MARCGGRRYSVEFFFEAVREIKFLGITVIDRDEIEGKIKRKNWKPIIQTSPSCE